MDCSSDFRVSSPKTSRIKHSEAVPGQCSNLPSELLLTIADRLGIIELLSFRGVCKHWNASSSTASAEIESSREPWFLLYGESNQCQLVSIADKEYKINIPELDGVDCIASNNGWLLLFKEGSIFFFCPFSRAKIDLPKFPILVFSNLVAAFTSPPTAQDCIVSVIYKNENSGLELYVLYRGSTVWTKHEFSTSPGSFDKIGSGYYFDGDGTFDFANENLNRCFSFSIEGKNWSTHEIISWDGDTGQIFYATEDPRAMVVKNILKLDKDVSISTCGTTISQENYDRIISNECIEVPKESETRRVKGVWIHPRFFQVPPNQSWA